MGRRVKRQTEEELVSDLVSKLSNRGLMLLLFETPSGFALFSFSEVHLHLPNTMKRIWSTFAEIGPSCVVILKGFQTFEDKSSTINADTGVNKQLADMINKWRLPRMKLAVGKPEYKTIIEKELGMTCVHNEIVMEVMWGIQHQMRHLVPEEKAEVAKEDRLPMSRGLKKLLRRYGFNVKPEMVNDQIVLTARDLFECDDIYDTHLPYLSDAYLLLKDISGINCEQWGALKLATALKVIWCPKEDGFHEVLSEDVLLKLKDQAPKYQEILSKAHCLRTYKRILFAHKDRAVKKRLLASLVEKAKEACETEQAQACETEQAQACERGKLQGESEQIPQEYVMFSNLCRMILGVISTPRPKGVKRSWDSTLNERYMMIANCRRRFSYSEPSTSKAIVPYKPVPLPLHVLCDVFASFSADSIDKAKVLAEHSEQNEVNDIENQVQIPSLTEPMEQIEFLERTLSSVGDSKDEAKLLAEHSEQNEVNDIENQVQFSSLTEPMEQIDFLERTLASVSVGKDEAKLLVEHSEQNEVNDMEYQVHVQASGSGSPPNAGLRIRRPVPVRNPSTPLSGKVVRRSPRLNKCSIYQHVLLLDNDKAVRRSPRLNKGSSYQHVLLHDNDTPGKRRKTDN